MEGRHFGSLTLSAPTPLEGDFPPSHALFHSDSEGIILSSDHENQRQDYRIGTLFNLHQPQAKEP